MSEGLSQEWGRPEELLPFLGAGLTFQLYQLLLPSVLPLFWLSEPQQNTNTNSLHKHIHSQLTFPHLSFLLIKNLIKIFNHHDKYI